MEEMREWREGRGEKEEMGEERMENGRGEKIENGRGENRDMEEERMENGR